MESNKQEVEVKGNQNIILGDLKNQDIDDTLEYAQKLGVTHNALYADLNSLFLDGYLQLEHKQKVVQELTDEGRQILKEGSPEFSLYKSIPAEGINKDELQKQVGMDENMWKNAFSKGMRVLFNLVEGTKLTKVAENLTDTVKEELEAFSSGKNSEKVKELIKRKLISEKNVKYFKVTKGENYREQRVKFDAEITVENLKEWKTKEFKSYNWKALGKEENYGNLHPLMKVKKQYREVLLEMGFEEMPTNQFVESSFYNFDALYVPQQHPARDEHDTFFINDPENARIDNKEYMQKVKNVHEKGGYGSIGYDYNWSEEVTQQNVFRTHTTAVTSRMLSKLGEDYEKTGVFQPKKFFSIDRVFRNETLDSTHLAEFHQIEGIVADRNVGLGHLIGIFTEFFHKIGMKDLMFKPTYNPYTEPSLEIHGWHPVLGKIVELGNSGVFRPEMLRPMGLPEDVNVLGWGLGLERPTMIQYGYDNIRELFGYKVDLKMIKSNAIVSLK